VVPEIIEESPFPGDLILWQEEKKYAKLKLQNLDYSWFLDQHETI
jgi:hypothetical protein